MSMNWNKVLATASVVAALAGCAGTPPAPQVADAKPAEPANCLRYTGTRIPIPEGRCVAYAGRVYTAEQLRSTGAPSVPDALNVLGAY
jgi:hypothetical protein